MIRRLFKSGQDGRQASFKADARSGDQAGLLGAGISDPAAHGVERTDLAPGLPSARPETPPVHSSLLLVA